MSYILEALKRAEAERDRGAVPTLHSQPRASSAATSGARAVSPMVGALSALLVVALVVIATLWWRGRGAADSAPVTAAPAAQPAAVAPPVVAAAPTTPTTPAAPPAPAPRPKPAQAPLPAAAPAAQPTPPPARAAAVAPALPVPVVAAAKTAPVVPAAEAPSRIYAVAELPPDVRQQLPRISINGASYSEQPAYRMLIVNGQVFHEKDEITGGLVLESIGPKSAVLRFNGYRFSQGF